MFIVMWPTAWLSRNYHFFMTISNFYYVKTIIEKNNNQVLLLLEPYY